MSKKNNALLIGGAAIAAVIIVPGLLKKTEQAAQGALNYFGSDGGGFPDLSGLFGGISDMFSSIGGLGGGLGGNGGGITDFLAGFGLGGGGNGGGGGGGTPFDFEAFLKAFFGGGGGGGGGIPQGVTPGQGGETPGTPDKPDWWNTPLIPATGNVPVDWGNAISQTAMSLAKAGLTGAGIYAGVKVGVPVLNAIAPRVATALSTPVSQIAGNIGRAGVSVSKAGASGVTRVLAATGRVLTSPVTKLGIGGTAAAIPLVAAAAYGGYKAGELFNKTAVGQALIEKSGEAGAAFARTNIGANIFGVASRQQTTEFLKKKGSGNAFQNKYGITLKQAQGMTTAQLQALIKK